MNSTSKLSIVATCYNDAEIIPELVATITKNVIKISANYEIILVNDGSRDHTEKVIEKICLEDSNVKGISLNRNFGQQIAMSAGIKHTTGDYIVIMDGDLQNPPDAIPLLYNEIIKGFDIVYTVSKKRTSFLAKITSMFFWFIIKKLFRVDIVSNQLMLKIMTKSFVDKYNQYTELHRTVSGIVKDISSNYSIIKIKNQERASGKSHYNFFTRVNLMLDLIIDLSTYPLNIMIYLGFLIFFVTCFLGLYYLYLFIFKEVPVGYTSILFSIFFFGSMTILLLGFIGKYLANIYVEVKNRPYFHVKQTFNL